MDEHQAANRLGALGNLTRLRLYRLLVRAGAQGLNIGDLQRLLDVAPSTLAHHLASLVRAGLVRQEQRGREVFSRTDYAVMDGLVDFIRKECCTGFANSDTKSDRDRHPKENGMSRLQLAINVTDLDEAIEFYSRMFDARPAKVKPGYANFAIAEPPLKLVLFEGPEGATINHLGVEVETAQEVTSAERRLNAAGLQTTGVDETVCCYAEKAETWVVDPDGARWEWYVKSGDAEQMNNAVVRSHPRGAETGPDVGPCCPDSRACCS